MPFEKNKSGNPNGRTKGTKNEKTLQWEELGHSLLTRHSERANSILAQCNDDVFMDNYGKLLEYFMPKLARTETKMQAETETTIRFVHDNDSIASAPLGAKAVSAGAQEV